MLGYKKILSALVIFLVLAVIAAGVVMAASSYNVAPASDTTVNEHGICYKMNPPAGKNIFVPTNTAAEWASFRAATPGLGITLNACPPCTGTPWGTILSNDSVIAYQDSSVPCGSTCVSETRACTNGTLSGTYVNTACSAENACPVCPEGEICVPCDPTCGSSL